jgi:hypothetical protein
VTPFLILDGHGSHFELPFLYNVSSAEVKWTLASWWLSTTKWSVQVKIDHHDVVG